MPLYYADASALVKLVRDEPESDAVRAFTSDADVASCEIALAELPRAVRRGAEHEPAVPLERLLERVHDTIEAVALVPLDRELILTAGALPEPSLRTLDALHIAAALAIAPIDGFVTYDERQAAAARLVGLRTLAPSSSRAD